MNLEDLSKEEWDLLEKCLSTKLPYWKNEISNFVSLEIKFSMLRENHNIEKKGPFLSLVMEAISTPFERIPLVLSNSWDIGMAVYQFRLLVGK